MLAAPAFVALPGRLALAWARRRCLGVASACGISLALAICAAAWLSNGTSTSNLKGAVVLCAGYLVAAAGPKLAEPAWAGRGLAGEAEASAWPVAAAAGDSRRVRPRQRAGLTQARAVGWVAVLASSLAECVVYAGLAAGATAERWAGMWTLAVTLLSFVAVRNLMTASSTPAGFNDEADGAVRKIARAVLTMPVGGRVLLIAVVAPVWGCRASLLALLDWAIISVGYGIAGRVAPGLSESRLALVALRDDGAIARGLGRLVRGNLLPLPPATLGLAAVAALAAVGLHGLPGILVIGPAIVMLVAAPGSSNQHTARFDWLVPVLLQAAQFLYLIAIGLAAHVPGVAIFVLCATLLLHYADLAFPGRPVLLGRQRQSGPAAELGTGLGWEGRMLLVGLGAAMGIATVTYLALAAYLAVLIGVKVVTRFLVPQQDEEQ